MSIKMDYPFMVEAGWPQDGALYSNETITSGSTLAAGDVVAVQADGTVDVAGAVSATQDNVGWIVRGNGDSDSVAAAGDRAVVLWGGFIARTTKIAAASYQPGTRLEANGGILQPVTTGAVVATVKAVHAAANGDPLSVTIIVK